MTSRLFLRAAFWLALLLPVALRAEVPVSYLDEGRALFTVHAPDFWEMRSGGDRELVDEGGAVRQVSRVLGFAPIENAKVWVGLVSPAGVHDLDGARDYLSEAGKFLVHDATRTGEERRRIGGRAALVIRGTGQRFSRQIEWTATVISLPLRRVAIAIAIVEARAEAAQVAQLNALLTSFQAH